MSHFVLFPLTWIFLAGSLGAQTLDLVRWQQLFREPGTEPASTLEKTFLLVRQAIPEENRDSTAARAAVETAGRRLLEQKDEPATLVLEAAARGILARNSSNPFEQIGEVNQAFALFDRAALLAKGQPEEWLVRLLRGTTYLYLPDFFQKKTTAEEDLAWVNAALNTDSALHSLLPVLLFYQGEHEGRLHHSAEAKRLWNQVLVEAATNGLPASVYEVRKARERLGK